MAMFIFSVFLLWLCLFEAAFSISLEKIELKGNWENFDGVEIVYQLPPKEKTPTGVLFVAHGCSHSSTDWWPKSTACPKCIGLPTIVTEGLRRNLLVIGISSSNRNHKCWTHQDIKPVTKAINYIYKSYLNTDLTVPLFLLGASSGGAFAGLFGLGNSELLPQVRAVCVQISAIHKTLSVPVLFNLMEKDRDTIAMVEEKKATQYPGGYKILISPALPITATFFSEHSAVRSAKDSESIQKALLNAGYLNKETLHLLDDPRRSDWRSVRMCSCL